MEELLKAIRMQSDMLTQIGESQARIEMRQASILLALDALATAIGDFCDYTRQLIEMNPADKSEEKETQQS